MSSMSVGESRCRKQLKSLLVNDLTVGGDVLDRALFYRLSSGFSDKALSILRDEVVSEVKSYYAGVRAKVGGDAARDDRFVERAADSWFRPWTRLAGRIEDAVDLARTDRVSDGKAFGVDEFVDIVDSFARLPEYAPYFDLQVKGFVYNRCEEMGFDYLRVPVRFLDGACVESYLKDHPGYERENPAIVSGLRSCGLLPGGPDESILKDAAFAERLAMPVRERITGNYAGLFGNAVFWDHALDFKTSDPAFVGLRWKDFEDSKAIHVLYSDGESVYIGYLPHSDKAAVIDGLRKVNEEAESIYRYIHLYYGNADRTREEIGGNFAKDFAGTAHWSRAVDLDVKDWPELRGVRYIDFKDCTNVHFLMKDGDSVDMYGVPLVRLRQVKDALLLKLEKDMSAEKNKSRGLKM